MKNSVGAPSRRPRADKAGGLRKPKRAHADAGRAVVRAIILLSEACDKMPNVLGSDAVIDELAATNS